MATTDRFAVLPPAVWNKEQTGFGTRAVNAPITGAGQTTPVQGLLLTKASAGYNGYQVLDYIGATFPTGTVFGTGITVITVLNDDPNNPGLGLAVRLGVSFKLVQSGTTATTEDFATGFAPEQLFTVTMGSTAGVPTITNMAIAKGAASVNIDAITSSCHYLIRIRRLGDASADTHPGDVLLSNVILMDT
jgi:hypothetical protein